MNAEWKFNKIGDVCEIVNGGTPATNNKQYWGGHHLWITPKDMGRIQGVYVDNTERKITEAGLKNSSAKMLPVNSIILSSRAPIGHLAITKKEISTNQGCKGLIPSNKILPMFLYYFLKQSVELLNSLGSGTTFKELSSKKLSDVEIPVPPLPEQQRIVAILDEAFAAIDQAKANTEKNLRNVRELNGSILDTIFLNSGEDWVDRKILEVSEIGDGNHGGNYPKKTDMRATGVPFIRSVNLVNGKISEDNMNYISVEKHNTLKKGHLKTGDVLFTNRGEIGKSGIVDERYNDANLNSQIAFFRCREDVINKFLYYFLQTPNQQKAIKNSQTGTALQQLTVTQIEKMRIKLPPIEEQLLIVKKLDHLTEQILLLEENGTQKITHLEELKKSILRKAFNGEL